ncbi:MAG: glycoside hydrolase family 25 protein, partial [Alphaproteobacteria bacterium]|nr:glycoside hydrolase family 25 protein [Alphaproteobacteria bacterium]
MLKYSLPLLLIFLVTVACAYITYDKGAWRFNYPDYKDYPIHGLDISHHQGQIDWPSVDNQKYKFVFIKATEGGDFKDRLFEKNWENAGRSGFLVGAYHFFTLCRDGRTQALNFIESVPSGQNSMPPVVDLEFVGNCSKRPSKQEFLQELSNYVALIEETYNQKTIIYTTYEFFEDYLAGSSYETYPLWIRDIFKKPSSHFLNWGIWQYADNAKVNGINGRVDLNVMDVILY